MSTLLMSGDDLFSVKSTVEHSFEKSIYTLIGIYGNERSFDFFVFRELKYFLPFQTDEEASEFLNSVLSEGIIEPIVLLCTVDGDYILIDGHHRLEIAITYSLDIKVRFIEDNSYSLSSFIDGSINFEPLKQRMLGIQGSRRNLSPDRLKYLRGLLYLSKAKQQGGDTKNRTNVAKELAKKDGVGVNTVYADAEYAKNMDIIKALNPYLYTRILNQNLSTKVSKVTVKEIAELTDEKLRTIVRNIACSDDFDAFLLALARKKAAEAEVLLDQKTKKKSAWEIASEIDMFDEEPAQMPTARATSFEQKIFSRKPYYMSVYIYSNARIRPIWESVGLLSFVEKNSSQNLLLDIAEPSDVVGFFIEKGLDLKIIENKQKEGVSVYGIIRDDGQVFSLCCFSTVKTLSL